MYIEQNNKNYILIFITFSITWFPLLFIFNNVYWDDWVLVNQQDNVLTNLFNSTGSLFAGYVHNILLSIGNGVLPYRIVTFISYLLITLSVYVLARPENICGKNNALYIAIFVAIFPVNTTRVALICLSGFYVALFFLAFILLIHKKNSIKYRVLSLILFFVAFEVQSLLVFYILPICYLFFISSNELFINKRFFSILKGIKIFTFKYIDFVLLPFVFYIIKKVFFITSGAYKNYNSISISWDAFNWPYYSLNSSFYKPINAVLETLSITNIMCIIFFGIMLSVIFNIKDTSLKNNVTFLLIGCILFIAAIFPYYAVGKQSIEEWGSRFQILTPFGSSLILFYSIKIIFNKNSSYFILSTCIVLFMSFHLNNLKNFHIDGFKQDAIMFQMQSINGVIEAKNKIILFDDKTKGYNALNRFYRFYEWNGMMKKIYMDESKFGLHTERYSKAIGYKKYSESLQYNFSTYKGNGEQIAGTVHIKKTPYEFNFTNILKLLYLKIIDKNRYDRAVIKYINLEYIVAKR